MNLYLCPQEKAIGYDTYDSCVVAAETAEEAATISPKGVLIPDHSRRFYDWVNDPKDVECRLIGKADDNVKKGVILASYNAG